MTQVRFAKIEDTKRISYVLASSWKTAYRGTVHDEYLDALKYDHWVEFLNKGIESGSIFSMVIESDEEIIGAAVLGKTEKESEVNLISFYLLPDKIGYGFGHEFYSAIETGLRSMGFLSCIVDVLRDNSRAIDFYKSHGFTDTGKEIDAVVGGQSYMCRVLEKSLL
jgi:ribosomal protein S18 acetylase RimI-like enzyme